MVEEPLLWCSIMFEWPFILDFWIGPLDAEGVPPAEYQRQWYEYDRRFERVLRRRFSTMVLLASEEGLDHWRNEPGGALAEIMLLDQFAPRVYSRTQMAYRNAPLAQRLAREGVEAGRDASLPLIQRAFFYLPYQHAENRPLQKESLTLYDQLRRSGSGRLRELLEAFYQSALENHDTVARFGRFPQRNETLKRRTTEQEQAFLRELAQQG